MRLANHERKRHDEEFIVEVVADVQDSAAPILCAMCHGQRTHDASCVVSRFREAINGSAVPIAQNPSRVGAMEIDLGHYLPPLT
jgi:hypothetical protein